MTSTVGSGCTNNNNIALNVNHATNNVTNTPNLNLTTQNVPTIQRIGSIGRTTITCITPAGGDAVAAASHPQAALAAAGVELDAVEDNNSLAEVVVKIENSATSSQDDDEEMPDDGEDAPTTETNDEDEEGDMTYDDIKLSSPMMWAIDSVKIEQEEEFEDILTAGLDNTTTTASLDNEDEFLQALPTGTPISSNLSMSDVDLQKNRVLVAKKRVSLETLKSINKQTNNKNPAFVTQIELQDPQELLEKHQHFQKLRLQPNQPVQIKLRSIPATITSIQPKQTTTTTPPLAPLSTVKPGNNDLKAACSSSSAEFKSTISEDRRYRMITQNQRTRKESLEHSDDMIYNADIEKPWVCRNCNRNYKWKNSLKCHLKNECGQPPRYFCSKLCGYATNVHSNLKRHMNTKCRERTEEENQTLLQQVQVQQPQLLHQTKSQTSTSSTVTTNTTAITTSSASPNNNNNNTLASTSNNNSNSNQAINTTTGSNTTSTYTLVFQKSE